MKIAILEDDPAQAELVKVWLEDEGHTVVHAERCDKFITLYSKESPDLLILDWQLPDSTGLEVLKTLKTQYDSKVPIIFCTQRNTETDIVNALKYGADDFLTKPLRQAELLARLMAIGRRAGIENSKTLIELGPIQLDIEHERIFLHGEQVKLTRKDFLVAKCLITNFGKVLSREFLLKQVWGLDTELDTRTVDVHVSRVRRSLKISPEMGYLIKTIYLHGYRLEKV